MADIPDGVNSDVALMTVAWGIVKATTALRPGEEEERLVTMTNDFIRVYNALGSGTLLEEASNKKA